MTVKEAKSQSIGTHYGFQLLYGAHSYEYDRKCRSLSIDDGEWEIRNLSTEEAIIETAKIITENEVQAK